MIHGGTVLVEAVATIDREIAATERRLRDLRVLRNAAGTITAGQAPLGSRNGNTKTVAAILRAAPQPMASFELVEAVADRGQPMTKTQVRSSLAHLRRRGLVAPVSRGRWCWAGTSSDVPAGDDTAPNEGAVVG